MENIPAAQGAANMPKRRLGLRLWHTLAFLAILGLALGAWSNSARRQRNAVAEIERVGGRVTYDFNPDTVSGPSKWLIETFGPDAFHNVSGLQLTSHREPKYDAKGTITGSEFLEFGPYGRDDIGRWLAAFPQLKSLSLEEMASDELLADVGRLSQLENLKIPNSHDVSDEGIANLVGLKKLRTFSGTMPRLTDDALASLARLPSLETITFFQGHFTDAGLAHLKGHGRLREIVLGEGSHITDAGLAHLHELRKTLKFVAFGRDQSTGEGRKQLSAAIPGIAIGMMLPSKPYDPSSDPPLAAQPVAAPPARSENGPRPTPTTLEGKP